MSKLTRRVTVSSSTTLVVLVALLLFVWEYRACDLSNKRWFDGPLNCSQDNTLYFLLSRPSSIFAYAISGNYDSLRLFGGAWKAFFHSFLALLICIFLSSCGLCVGAFFPAAQIGLYSLVWLLQIIPFIALSWVLSLTFGAWDKVAFGVIVGIFPIASNLLYAVSKLPPKYEEVLAIYKAPISLRLTNLIIPRIVSPFFSALYLAAPLCMVGVLIADLNGGESAGLGLMIFRATREQDANALAVESVVAVTLSLILYGIVALAEALCLRLFPWYRSERSR